MDLLLHIHICIQNNNVIWLLLLPSTYLLPPLHITFLKEEYLAVETRERKEINCYQIIQSRYYNGYFIHPPSLLQLPHKVNTINTIFQISLLQLRSVH